MITCGPPPCAAGAGASSVPKRRVGGAGEGGPSARTGAAPTTIDAPMVSAALQGPTRRWHLMERGGPPSGAVSTPTMGDRRLPSLPRTGPAFAAPRDVEKEEARQG